MKLRIMKQVRILIYSWNCKTFVLNIFRSIIRYIMKNIIVDPFRYSGLLFVSKVHSFHGGSSRGIADTDIARKKLSQNSLKYQYKNSSCGAYSQYAISFYYIHTLPSEIEKVLLICFTLNLKCSNEIFLIFSLVWHYRWLLLCLKLQILLPWKGD